MVLDVNCFYVVVVFFNYKYEITILKTQSVVSFYLKEIILFCVVLEIYLFSENSF